MFDKPVLLARLLARKMWIPLEQGIPFATIFLLRLGSARRRRPFCKYEMTEAVQLSVGHLLGFAAGSKKTRRRVSFRSSPL